MSKKFKVNKRKRERERKKEKEIESERERERERNGWRCLLRLFCIYAHEETRQIAPTD